MRFFNDARPLLPLLDSIRRELEERAENLTDLESRNDATSQESELQALAAEVAVQRRELDRCRRELEGLGCSVLGTMPLTFHIRTLKGSKRKSVIWQHGLDPLE